MYLSHVKLVRKNRVKIFGHLLENLRQFSDSSPVFLESSVVFEHPLKYSGIVGEWPEIP